jgi:hypothetical protein
VAAQPAGPAHHAGETAFLLNRLNIGPRLTIGFAFIVFAMLVGNGVLLWQFHQAQTQTELLNGVDQELIAILQAHVSLM